MEGSEGFFQQLTQWGADIRQIPLIQVQPIPFILPPNKIDWLFFTSKNGVHSFYKETLRQNPQWTKIPVAAVGPATAQAVRDYGIEVSYVAPQFDAESAADDFGRHYANQGLHCIWPCGNLANPSFAEILDQAGIQVTPLVVYETTERSLSPTEAAILKQTFDLIIFTSPSAVRAFSHLQPHLASQIACLGPKTAQAAEQVFHTPAIQPSLYTFASLENAIQNFYSQLQETSHATQSGD